MQRGRTSIARPLTQPRAVERVVMQLRTCRARHLRFTPLRILPLSLANVTATPPERPDRLSRWERRVAVTKNLVEILAILVAGCWAYKRFIETEAPAQKRNFVTAQDIAWEVAEDGTCYAIVDVTFENISRGEIEIQKAVRRAWLVQVPPFSAPISYVDPDTLANATPIDSMAYTSGPFVQRYPPGARTTY